MSVIFIDIVSDNVSKIAIVLWKKKTDQWEYEYFCFMISLIMGMFSLDQRKLNFAFFSAVFRVPLKLKLCFSANFCIWSISSLVVDSVTICERMFGTSAFDLNLKISICSIICLFCTQKMIALTFLQFVHVCSLQNLAPIGYFVDVAMLKPKPCAYLGVECRQIGWDPSISGVEKECEMSIIFGLLY